MHNMNTNWDTPAQAYAKSAMFWIVIIGLLAMAAANVRALVVCSPQAGKWTPWTGTVCYGEKPEAKGAGDE